MTQKGNIIKADEGKVFRRIESGEVFGNEMYLGYSWYIGGVKLNTPHKDVADDFDEIDDPNPELNAQL